MNDLPYISLNTRVIRYRKSRYSLSNITIDIPKGATIGIVGESGSGKSTLGKIFSAAINSDDVQSYGVSEYDCHLFIDEPELEGINIIDASNRHINVYRKHVQYIFQNHRAALNMNDTVYSSLYESYRSGNYEKSVKHFHDLIRESLEKIGLIPHSKNLLWGTESKTAICEEFPFLKQRVKQLSGGQMKRISILKSLLFHPNVIIADEPLTGLDASKKGMVLELLRSEKQKRIDTGDPLTTIIISHDVGMINNNCDIIYVMFGSIRRGYGEIVEVVQNKSSLSDITPYSSHPYTAELLEASEYFKNDSIIAKTLFSSKEKLPIDQRGCLYFSRCGSIGDSAYDKCLKPQELRNSKMYPPNKISCHKCT
jgi:ABC-type glutathione transport system ATPase component